MKRFVLIEACDRNLTLQGCFSEKEDALSAMEEKLADAAGLKSVPSDWDNTGLSRGDAFDIEEDSAWINTSSYEIDWNIFEIE